jgi:hypothetical protein
MNLLINTIRLRQDKERRLRKGFHALFLHEWVEKELIKRVPLGLTDPLVYRGFFHGDPSLGIHSFYPKDHGLTEPLLLPFQDHLLPGFIDSMELHLYNDIPGALKEVKRVLKPKGWYLGALLGGDSGKGLRQALLETESLYYNQASLKLLPTVRPETLINLMQKAGFQDIVLECIDMTLEYTSLKAMMADIRGAGENRLFQTQAYQMQKRLWAHMAAHWKTWMPLKIEILFIRGQT